MHHVSTSIPTSLADSQHNQYDKYLLPWIQYWDPWWPTVSLSETRRVLYQNKVGKYCILLAFRIRLSSTCFEQMIVHLQEVICVQTAHSWVKTDQLDVTCVIISLFNAQHVLDVNTSILRSLRLIYWVISWVVLIWFDVCWCYLVVWLWWCGIRMQAEAFSFFAHALQFIIYYPTLQYHVILEAQKFCK